MLGRGAEGRPLSHRVPHGLDGLEIGVAEEERPEGHDPVDVALAFDRFQIGALAPPHEERLVEADGFHRPHRRVDASWDQAPSQAGELGLGL